MTENTDLANLSVPAGYAEEEGELVLVGGAAGKPHLAAALSKAQLAFKAIPKNKTARIEKRAGGTYTYRYADLADILEVVRKPLADNGLAVTQPLRWRDGGLWLDTILMHDSGEQETAEYPLPLPASANSPQVMGSAITYARRYTLGSLLGIATEEDDDAAKASKAENKKKRITKKQYEALVQAAKVKGLDKDGFRALVEKVCDHNNPTRLTVEQWESALKVLELQEAGDKALAAAAEAKAEEAKAEEEQGASKD